MNKRVMFGLTLFILSTLLFSEEAISWNQLTHMDLSEYAAENSVLRGCIDETDANCDLLKNKGRFNNHFHAPARGWADPLPNDLFYAGLDDDVYIRHTGGEIVC